ncbi:dTDP-4-dehydrorhamnose reductase [Desulfurivibrio alkaliphilus]|uniref:dTDP-4-dehydrorhamnose reductase n=1 Tax=Desulfurivibrio alkaliphilus (strain DSM 19089 / UNIQEM U267 / AHT2) TaxID=589865 RepID=D6Z4N7_DESAT|nr:dTDP-4-dehydrorhamnose reductase [Desulfurivibrio alkaliphilus]ADH86512.1 dTDP-4-dehydrorhamnose reductase [Desulfurivibrio alkaliphilus AHT 2]
MMDRPLLLFGAEGQVGWELQRSLAVLGPVLALTRREVDLSDREAVRAAIRAAGRPAAVVNAGAYTAVDKAEDEAETAYAVNAAVPAAMAAEAKAIGVPLVHFSTDYVYNGDKAGPYLESDAPDPQSVYGRSKLEGDAAIIASGVEHLILRTTWVYAARGGNFLRTMLRLAGERDQLRVIADQVGAPTSAELLADITAHALRLMLGGKAGGGLYHCTAAGETSWHGYARFIVAEAAALGRPLLVKPEQIEPIPTEAYPLPAKRPKNSRLDCRRLEAAFGLVMPPWQFHVQRTLKELIES